MSDEKQRKIALPRGGVVNDITLRLKLLLRLMGDPRVNPVVKVLPIASLIYLIWPLDLAIGPVDDAAVVWLGFTLFVELCPPEVVQEHMARLKNVIPGEWREPTQTDEVIDAEVVEDKETQ